MTQKTGHGLHPPLKHGGFIKVATHRFVFWAAALPVWVRIPENFPTKYIPSKNLLNKILDIQYAISG
jgi:hypothetical protein